MRMAVSASADGWYGIISLNVCFVKIICFKDEVLGEVVVGLDVGVELWLKLAQLAFMAKCIS